MTIEELYSITFTPEQLSDIDKYRKANIGKKSNEYPLRKIEKELMDKFKKTGIW